MAYPSTIRARRYDADSAGVVVIDFPVYGQQSRADAWAGNNALASKLVPQDFDLGFEEAHSGVTPGCQAFAPVTGASGFATRTRRRFFEFLKPAPQRPVS